MTDRVERRILARLAALPGANGQTLAAELVEAYLARMPESLDRCAALVAERGAEELCRTAHSLRGSALLLGANVLAALLLEVELAAERGAFDACPAALEAVAAEWPATAEALRSAATALPGA